MLTAFCRHADGRCETLHETEGIAAAWSEGGTALWVDLEAAGEEELQDIGKVFQLDAEALEDCIHGEQRPRTDEFDGYVFLVLYGMQSVEQSAEFDPRKLAAFVGERFLVTVHREPLLIVGGVRARCERRTSQMLGRGVDFVLFTVIDGMVDKYTTVLESYEDQLDGLEEASLSLTNHDSFLADLSALRRKLLELRRIAASQIELIAPLAKGECEWISESLERRFSHVRDHLAHVVERIDGFRELLNGVRDNHHTALANRMNAVMKTLTVFASILLPLSVVAGIYGMNLALWPGPENPLGFWVVLAAMAGIAAVLLVYFHRRKWF